MRLTSETPFIWVYNQTLPTNNVRVPFNNNLDKGKSGWQSRYTQVGSLQSMHTRDSSSGIATLLALSAVWHAASLCKWLQWKCCLHFCGGLCHSFGYPQFRDRNLTVLCQGSNTTLVKVSYWGQIVFPQRFLWRDGLSPFFILNFFLRCPLFYLKFFLRTSIVNT